MSGTENNQRRKNYRPDAPLISIITVVFNAVNTLEQTIQSVINQNYESIEYIIIDGGSTDGTLDIIKKYDNQIDKWLSEPDKGIYDAMNKGINLATGELVGIINADDWYEPDVIAYIAGCYKNSDRDVVIHGLLRNFKDNLFYSIKGNSIQVLRYDMIQHPTCFIPKLIYLQHGVYDIQYKCCADYDLILRYVNSGIKFNFIEQTIANFRIGGISTLDKFQKEKYLILRKYGMISGAEAVLRIVYLYFANVIKKVIGH